MWEVRQHPSFPHCKGYDVIRWTDCGLFEMWPDTQWVEFGAAQTMCDILNARDYGEIEP